MQEVDAELFFNAGDIDRQSNWLIFPSSLNAHEMQEILEIICRTYEEVCKGKGLVLFEEIEKKIKSNSSYPDPTKFKVTTRWRYAQLKMGAIVYRFGLDGRRESDSNRMNHSIEGAFLNGINLERTRRRYLKDGVDIVEEIGKQLPDDIEKILVARNFDIFENLYRQYEAEGRMSSLYNHFYVACYGNEISASKRIKVRPMYEIGPFSKFFK